MRLTYKNKIKYQYPVSLPASKSISNRLLILQFLFPDIQIEHLSNARDTAIMQRCLHDIKLKKKNIDVEDAGTVFRFLTALLSIVDGDWELTGTERMLERPIAELVDALRSLGADIEYGSKPNFAPLRIKGKPLIGGELKMKAHTSSQFITALMLIGSSLERGIQIDIQGDMVSADYVKMNLSILEALGFSAVMNQHQIHVYSTLNNRISSAYPIESDWSAASYFYAIAAMIPGIEIELPQLYRDSAQGDACIAEIMQEFGVHTAFQSNGILISSKSKAQINVFEYDFIRCPDLAQTIISLCGALNMEGKFRGLSTLKNKETDRILALQIELEKLGHAFTTADGIVYHLEKRRDNALPEVFNLTTYHDHRMAMAFAPWAVLLDIEIDDREVVNKSFPRFWDEIRNLGFEIQEL